MENPEANIILTGYRATGKTTVGRELARALGFEFVDTDKLIEAREGRTIKSMVDALGWQYFRDRDVELLLELARECRKVISTGGGALLNREAWKTLTSTGLTVWLTADVATICRRLEEDAGNAEQRPSLTGQSISAEVSAVLREREPLYRQGSDLEIDTSLCSVDEITAQIREAYLARFGKRDAG